MAEHEVDVAQSQPPQRRVHAFHDVLAAESYEVGTRPCADHDLGRDHEILAGPQTALDTSLDDSPHELFGFAAGVDLGVVEEVDAARVGTLHDGVGLFEVQLDGKRIPRSKRERRDQQAAVAETALHPFSVSALCRSYRRAFNRPLPQHWSHRPSYHSPLARPPPPRSVHELHTKRIVGILNEGQRNANFGCTSKDSEPASLTGGVHGVVSFPSRGIASFRFEIVAKNEKLHIWLEDCKTKKQWHTAQLATADFVSDGLVIPQATFDDYAKCFLNCLESTTSGSDFTRDLVAVTDDTDAWELRLTLKIGVFTSKWTPTYKFLLKPVPLEPIDLLTAKIGDQEDEIAALKRQVELLEIQQEDDSKAKPAPLFVRGKLTNKVATGKLVWAWEPDSVLLPGKIVFQFTGSIRFTTGGTFVVNAMIQNNNNNNSTTAELLLNGKVVVSCADSNPNGHIQVSSIYHVLRIAPEDEISFMYRGTNHAQPGSYIVIHELR